MVIEKIGKGLNKVWKIGNWKIGKGLNKVWQNLSYIDSKPRPFN